MEETPRAVKYGRDLAWVCQYFAKRRIGALIVLEGKVQLGDMMKGGVVLDARISRGTPADHLLSPIPRCTMGR